MTEKQDFRRIIEETNARIAQQDKEKRAHGRFEPIPRIKTCRNASHFPPTHINVPNGMRYIHTCPACGNESVIEAPYAEFASCLKRDAP